MGTGYCFEVRVESMKKNILGSKCEIDAISLRNYKQNFKEFLRNICHNNFSNIPKPDNKSYLKAPKIFWQKDYILGNREYGKLKSD